MADERTLSGKRILIVEDEYFIATDLKRVLGNAGATVIGPVGTLAEGLDLAKAGGVDAAVLDVNLDGDRTYALADALRRADIPYLFLTGYDGWSLTPEYRAAPRLGKPFSETTVVEVLTKICDM